MANENVKEIQTVCGGCHNCCTIKAIIRDGKLVKLEGVQEDPRTKGSICAKALGGVQFVNDPTRLKHPLKRVGKRGENKWKQVSWDEALEDIAENFNRVKEKQGPRAVGFFKGQAPLWGFPFHMYERLAHAFGTEVGMGTSECFAPRLIGQAMTYAGMPLYPDYEHANMIICWGRQPAFSGATQMHSIFDAKERGAKLVVIDPLHFHIGAKADDFIRIEPGTDLALALAILHVIVKKNLWDHEFVNKYTNDPGLEKLREHLFGGNKDNVEYSPEWAEPITGIPSSKIKEFAEEIAHTKGICFVTGHGLEGRINVTQTARAIAILRLVTGNIDAPGGDVFTPMSPKLNAQFTLNKLVNPDEKYPEFVELMSVPQYNPPGCTYPLLFAVHACLPTPDLMNQMRNGEIKAAIFMGGNPMVMFPNTTKVKETFRELEFFAVIDPYLSETAIELADIVLPAASYLERTEPEWFKWDRWYPYLRMRRKVATVGEALPDWQICAKLGKKLGFDEYFPNEDVAYYTDLILEPSGITYEKLDKTENWIEFGDIQYKKYEKNGFGLPGGKAHVFSEIFAGIGYDPLPVYTEGAENYRSTPELAKKYPMICFTGRPGPMYVHDQGRTIPWVREMRPEPLALINPKDAAEYDLSEGDCVELESLRGKMQIQVKVTNVIAPKTLYVPGGWAQANYNYLSIDDKSCPISSQQNYTVCLARITKIHKEEQK
ncbi:MAG: molybdopterin-dependent oxidoreductase [Candidatus Vecturithrix sp.]|jgi:anaerobic selenocysteine-containing dehydrogenase|nr:molybdopterin-dependent oxidoreductase [Candidatus Vecturithrix sp.]